MSRKKTTKKNPNKKPDEGGRPLKFRTPQLLQKKIEAYFRSCFDYKRDMFGGRITDKKPLGLNKKTGKMNWSKGEYIIEQVKPFTVTGLALFLETTRETLMDYEKKYGDKFSDTIKKAKLAIYAYTEESLFTNKPTGPIFSLKNNYGWRDRKEFTGDDGGPIEVKVINYGNNTSPQVRTKKISISNPKGN